jgi:hypothetical protein
MIASGRIADRRNMLLVCLLLVIMAGLGSRMIHTGFPIADKYAGDALYAVMVFLIISLFSGSLLPLARAFAALIVMTALEAFQLTLLPREMCSSAYIMVRVAGRLLGTTFSWLDLVAYCVGIVSALLADQYWINTIREEVR